MRASRCRWLIAAAAAAAAAAPGARAQSTDAARPPPPAPRYPLSLSVAYNMTLPFTATFQPEPLTYVIAFARDASSGKARQDVDGAASLVATGGDAGHYVEVGPRIHRLACARYAADDESAALLELPVIPDVSTWAYAGRSTVAGVPADEWVLREAHGARMVTYRFWAQARRGEREDAQEATIPALPLRLEMHGPDLLSGSHFDHYVVDYDPASFDPRPPAAAVFEEPAACAAAGPARPRTRSFIGASTLLMPGGGGGRRAAAARENAAFVARHTRLLSSGSPGAPTHTLALNTFAGVPDAEFRATWMPPRATRAADAAPGPGELPYQRLLPPSRVPAALSWRGTPAAGAVKDQAPCGSCWAFGAAGALEGAWVLATGQPHSFSEQQLMDCSWNYGTNAACGGGDADAAIDWLVEKRGGRPADEAAYPYAGASGWCDGVRHEGGDGGGPDGAPPALGAAPALASPATPSRGPRVLGYARIPPGDDEAVMEALASRGPLQVSIDAAAKGFRFYSGGVYDEPACRSDEDGLDHSVTLVGYGVDGASGKQFWEVKNSWSTHWGDGGYVRIARARGGCGVPTAAVYAVVGEGGGEAASA